MDCPIHRRLVAVAFCTLGLGVMSCVAQTLPTGSPDQTDLSKKSVSTTPAAVRLLAMETIVNGAKSGTWLYLERAGVFYAPRDAFEDWRVDLKPDTPTIDFKGQTYARLDAVPGRC